LVVHHPEIEFRRSLLRTYGPSHGYRRVQDDTSKSHETAPPPLPLVF
jgi:hypothetical protein